MPTVIEETGSGSGSANSYVDPAGAFAVAYFAAHLHATAWTAATTAQKESAVIQATRMIDAEFAWQGQRKLSTQALGWPRSGVELDGVSQDDIVPTPLRQAVLEQALALLNGDRTGVGVSATSGAVSKIGLGEGALEIEMSEGQSATQNYNTGFLSDYVVQLLRNIGSKSGGRGGPSSVRTFRV